MSEGWFIFFEDFSCFKLLLRSKSDRLLVAKRQFSRYGRV